MATDNHCKNQLVAPDSSQCFEHYGCIYENNHLVTLLVSPINGKIIDANKAACTFYGYTIRQIRSLHISDINQEIDSTAEGFVTKAFPSGEYTGNQVFIERHQLADSRVIDVEIHTGIVTMLGKSCIYSVIHDISERVKAERRLKESEERYRDLVELCPEAILVYREGLILFANKQTEILFGKDKDDLIGKSIDTFFNEESSRGTLDLWGSHKKSFRYEQRLIRYDGRTFDLEISGAPIKNDDVRALQIVFRDITASKKEIERAVKLQEHRHAVSFPLETKAVLEKLYIPARTLSGDFFIFHKINEEQVVGIIGDVTGKGITAALNISALRVLFLDSLLTTHDPVQVLQDLNHKATQHLGEDYISACCFLLDFSEKKLKAAGAGINEFMYVNGDRNSEKFTIKGAPLGMFDSSEFDEVMISFTSGDRFCFYSDGMELLFDAKELCQEYEYLNSRIADACLQDDCTWLSLTIR